MFNDIIDWLNGYPLLMHSLTVLGVLFLSYISYALTRKYVLGWIEIGVEKSKTKLDDIIFDKVISRRLSFIPPILVIYNFAHLSPKLSIYVQRILFALIFLVILTTFTAFLNAVNAIYEFNNQYKGRPIKGYIQAATIIAYIMGLLVLIGIMTGQSLWMLLSGLGALTAVLMLVFRNTILSFVASIQITSSDLVRINDWIEVPKFGADGDVIDIALHTIKIQNFDKTVTVIPTHKLIEESFKNWRGMQESGGRRIKRAINFDITSIRFLDDQLLEKMERIELLKDYLAQKKEELREDNESKGIDTAASLVNGRRMTNIGTFRAYTEAYLKSLDKIADNMTFLVRQLASGPTGLPLQIYVFSNDTAWVNYEALQSDIFDHLFSVAAEFGLEIYQYPGGRVLKNILDK